MKLVSLEYAAFSQPYELKWEKRLDRNKATASLPNGEILNILFSLELGHMRPEDKFWEVEFSVGNHYKVDLTGEGDAFRIMATVVSAIQSFIDEKKPNCLFFTAKEPSRRKLYKAIIKKFNTQLSFMERDFYTHDVYFLFKKEKLEDTKDFLEYMEYVR